jgi:hypothetical protein
LSGSVLIIAVPKTLNLAPRTSHLEPSTPDVELNKEIAETPRSQSFGDLGRLRFVLILS